MPISSMCATLLSVCAIMTTTVAQGLKISWDTLPGYQCTAGRTAAPKTSSLGTGTSLMSLNGRISAKVTNVAEAYISTSYRRIITSKGAVVELSMKGSRVPFGPMSTISCNAPTLLTLVPGLGFWAKIKVTTTISNANDWKGIVDIGNDGSEEISTRVGLYRTFYRAVPKSGLPIRIHVRGPFPATSTRDFHGKIYLRIERLDGLSANTNLGKGCGSQQPPVVEVTGPYAWVPWSIRCDTKSKNSWLLLSAVPFRPVLWGKGCTQYIDSQQVLVAVASATGIVNLTLPALAAARGSFVVQAVGSPGTGALGLTWSNGVRIDYGL